MSKDLTPTEKATADKAKTAETTDAAELPKADEQAAAKTTRSPDDAGTTKDATDTGRTAKQVAEDAGGKADDSKQKKAAAKPQTDDQAATDRGPLGHAQDDSDGWGDLPVQMRGE